jgi:hypothetical protein
MLASSTLWTMLFHVYLQYFPEENSPDICSVETQVQFWLNWLSYFSLELHDLYSSPNNFRAIKSRRMRWAGHLARMGEVRVAYRVLVGNPDRKGQLGRRRIRWKDNNWSSKNGIGVCIGLIWLRIGTSGELLLTRSWTFGYYEITGNFLTSWGTVSLERTLPHAVCN